MSNESLYAERSPAGSPPASRGALLRRRLSIAVPVSIGLAVACAAVTGLIGRFILGVPVSAGANIAGHALTGAIAGMLAGTVAVASYELWARRHRTNDKAASQALKSGAIGAVIDAVMSALVNGLAIGVPTSLATQTSHHVVTGIISGGIAAFIGLMIHQAKTAAR
jgi:hypothetical protein